VKGLNKELSVFVPSIVCDEKIEFLLCDISFEVAARGRTSWAITLNLSRQSEPPMILSKVVPSKAHELFKEDNFHISERKTLAGQLLGQLLKITQ
jgi:hypothetical protein